MIQSYSNKKNGIKVSTVSNALSTKIFVKTLSLTYYVSMHGGF